MNDYVFLESCTNYASARRTDKIKRYTARDRSLPIPKMKLRKAAADSERQIKLQFLLPNFDKHKTNTTYYDWSSKVIWWCVEWRFINADNRIIIDERCSESKTITELIGKYFDCSNSISSLECYRTKGLEHIQFLLKAEGIRKSQNRFFVLDLSKTLLENLKGKTIVEYPVIYVIFASDLEKYDVISAGEWKWFWEKFVEFLALLFQFYFVQMKKMYSMKRESIKITISHRHGRIKWKNQRIMVTMQIKPHTTAKIQWIFSFQTEPIPVAMTSQTMKHKLQTMINEWHKRLSEFSYQVYEEFCIKVQTNLRKNSIESHCFLMLCFFFIKNILFIL